MARLLAIGDRISKEPASPDSSVMSAELRPTKNKESNPTSLNVKWTPALRSGAWEELWRRILTDIINGLTEPTDNCVAESKTDEQH